MGGFAGSILAPVLRWNVAMLSLCHVSNGGL